jgi:hypothetical protein
MNDKLFYLSDQTPETSHNAVVKEFQIWVDGLFSDPFGHVPGPEREYLEIESFPKSAMAFHVIVAQASPNHPFHFAEYDYGRHLSDEVKASASYPEVLEQLREHKYADTTFTLGVVSARIAEMLATGHPINTIKQVAGVGYEGKLSLRNQTDRQILDEAAILAGIAPGAIESEVRLAAHHLIYDPIAFADALKSRMATFREEGYHALQEQIDDTKKKHPDSLSQDDKKLVENAAAMLAAYELAAEEITGHEMDTTPRAGKSLER